MNNSQLKKTLIQNFNIERRNKRKTLSDDEKLYFNNNKMKL